MIGQQKSPQKILDFWFVDHGEKNWFGGSGDEKKTFDQKIKNIFLDFYDAGLRGELNSWMDHKEGSLALTILYDQFSRNMFRNTPKAFATDGFAKMIAMEAIKQGHDQETEARQRVFYYFPFEHSEDMADQARAVDLMRSLGDENYLDYALRHLELIAKYGKFPHRNPILGRVSSKAEKEYLAQPGAGF